MRAKRNAHKIGSSGSKGGLWKYLRYRHCMLTLKTQKVHANQRSMNDCYGDQHHGHEVPKAACPVFFTQRKAQSTFKEKSTPGSPLLTQIIFSITIL